MSKGTIVLVPFPFTDLSGNKVRPCVILYQQKKGEDCVVLFLSSVVPSRIGLLDIKVRATVENGLKRDSLLKVEKIATLQKKVILGKIGMLEPSIIKVMNGKLKHVFGL